MSASNTQSNVKTLDTAITHFMERELEGERVDTGDLYRAVQDRFPHSSPEQIERCALALAERLELGKSRQPSMGF